MLPILIRFKTEDDAVIFAVEVRRRFGFGSKALPDGTVRVGYGFGGLVHIDGETMRQIQKLAEDIDGVVQP
jgi:hypothetical protein